MAHVINETSGQQLAEESSTQAGRSASDVMVWLSAGASGAWEVEQEIDPAGEVSVIVHPTYDDPALPTFVLYEKDGGARVAVVRHDVWETERVFSSCEQAASSIIALTEAVSIAA